MSDKCMLTVAVEGGATHSITIAASLKEALTGGSDPKTVKIRDVDDTIWLFNFAKVVSIKVEDIN
jgi:hypothetical protein